MSVKPRKQVLARSDDRMIVHAGLFLVCAMLSAVGMGALAFWCFLPAAGLVELLSGITPGNSARRM